MKTRKLLVSGGRVLTPDGVKTADVLVEDDRIARVSSRLSSLGDAKVVDATGHMVVPGLVQARTALAHTSLRGLARGLDRAAAQRERVWPAEAALSSRAVYEGTFEGALELLRSGVTTVLDAGTTRYADSMFEALEAVGLRATVGRALLDRGQGLPAALKESPEVALEGARALIERWHGAHHGLLRVALAPRGFTVCSPALLERAAALAEAHGLVITVPYAESQAEVEAAREAFGGEPLGKLASPRLVVAHGTWLPSEAQRILRESGAHVVHCPTADLALGSGVAKVPELVRAGVRVCLSVGDAPAVYTLDPWAELRLAAILPGPRHGVLSPAEVLQMATLGGARALGLEAELGSIEPGKKADLIVVRVPDGARDVLEALVLGTRATDVGHVIVDGLVRVRQGRIVGVRDRRSLA